jgi:hypothetical protein
MEVIEEDVFQTSPPTPKTNVDTSMDNPFNDFFLRSHKPARIRALTSVS